MVMTKKITELFELIICWLSFVIEGKRIENEFERLHLQQTRIEFADLVMTDKTWSDGFEEEWE